MRDRPLELISSARPEALDQDSDARFIIVIYGASSACFAALDHGGHALCLNATVPVSHRYGLPPQPASWWRDSMLEPLVDPGGDGVDGRGLAGGMQKSLVSGLVQQHKGYVWRAGKQRGVVLGYKQSVVIGLHE